MIWLHSCNQTKQLEVLILSTEATCLREIFIKIFDLLTSSQWAVCYDVEVSKKKKGKESMGILPLFSSEVILSSDQASRSNRRDFPTLYSQAL